MGNDKKKPIDNHADQHNPNKGFPGQNPAKAKKEGNRGKQKNPNWTPPKPKDKK